MSLDEMRDRIRELEGLVSAYDMRDIDEFKRELRKAVREELARDDGLYFDFVKKKK